MNDSVFDSKQKRNHKECWRECKELNDWGSCEKGYMWNPSMCDCECNKACNIDEHLDIKNCSCEKRLIGKLVLECEGELINTTQNRLNDKKVECAKSNCLIHTISLVIICLCWLLFLLYKISTKITISQHQHWVIGDWVLEIYYKNGN